MHIYIYKEQHCNDNLRGVGIFKIEKVVRQLRQFF